MQDTKACSGLGLRGQHSPLEVQHSSSKLKTTWESEAIGLMIKSVLQEPAAAGDDFGEDQGIVVICHFVFPGPSFFEELPSSYSYHRCYRLLQLLP